MALLRFKRFLLLPLIVILSACHSGGEEEATAVPTEASSAHEVTGYYYNGADVLTYLHPVRMFEERGLYERSDGSMEVAHADTSNLTITLHPLVLVSDRVDVQHEVVDQALLYGVLKVFTHTKVDRLDLRVTPRVAIPVASDKAYEVAYLPEPNRHVVLTRAQAQAFLRAHTKARAFSDLVDTDKNWHHLRGADSQIYTDLYYDPNKTGRLVTILSQQYGPK